MTNGTDAPIFFEETIVKLGVDGITRLSDHIDPGESLVDPQTTRAAERS